MLHIPPTNYHVLAAKQESYQKAYLITKSMEQSSGDKVSRMDQWADKKTERATRAGRRTREEIAKWNQMTALRFQIVGNI